MDGWPADAATTAFLRPAVLRAVAEEAVVAASAGLPVHNNML